MKKYYLGLVAIVVVSIMSIVVANVVTKPLVEDSKIRIAAGDISRVVDSYVGKKGKLPEDIKAVIEDCEYGCDGLKERANQLEYRVVSNDTYEVCATFSRASEGYETSSSIPSERIDFNKHSAGRNCAQATSYKFTLYTNRKTQPRSSPSPSSSPQKSQSLHNRSDSERIATGCDKDAVDMAEKVKLTEVGFNTAGQYEIGYTGSDGKTKTYLVCEKAFNGTISKTQLKTGDTYTIGINSSDGVILSIK